MKFYTLLLGVALALGCAAEGEDEAAPVAPAPSADDEGGEAFVPASELPKADSFEPPDGPLVFDGACAAGPRVTVAAVGDVLLHGRLQRQGLGADDGFVSLWRGIADLLAAADVTYANLEGPTAAGVDARGRDVSDPGARFDDRVYTSYPMFNYHPSLLDGLIASGVDVVSTANNHSLDRWSLGADRTVDALEARGLPFTGTRKAGETSAERPWHALTRSNGVTLAWLACTYATNGIPDRDDQVLFCYEHRAELLAAVEALAADAGVDAVIVTPHWGLEYHALPADREVALAHDLLDAGATAVIGSHPHVLQPWERYLTADGRETFAIYSLGNFVSGQRHLPRRSTLLLYLGLTKTANGVVVNGARYVPLHMTTRANGSMELEAIDRVGGHAESRALTVEAFDAWNVHAPDAPLVTDPQCDPAWTPPPSPHPHDGWIGGRCADVDRCGGAELCIEGLPGGFCTQRCERTCPDRAGRATTFCVDLGFADGGVCVAQCGDDAECREGYACREMGRFGEPDITRGVCVPAG